MFSVKKANLITPPHSNNNTNLLIYIYSSIFILLGVTRIGITVTPQQYLQKCYIVVDIYYTSIVRPTGDGICTEHVPTSVI